MRRRDALPRSRHACARGLQEDRPSKNQRARGKPDARCTRGLVCKMHIENAHEHTGSAEAIRLSLHSGFTAYNALSPATGLSCHRRPRSLANLTPASGCQDHTSSPYAALGFAKKASPGMASFVSTRVPDTAASTA